MTRYEFEIPAMKYFETDADSLVEILETDVVYVILDLEKKTAQYTTITTGCTLGNGVWSDDDYDGALEQVLSYFGKIWEGA
jgi:hypothetical protein